MEKSLAGVKEWAKTHEGKKLIRYTLSSGITTMFSFAAIAIFYGFRLIPGVMWSTLAGNVVAVLPSYYLNRAWAWGKTGRSHFRREILPFISMSGLGIAFSQLFAYWAKHEVKSHHWSHLFNTGLVLFANLVSFAIFWVLKIIVFNRIFHVSKLHNIDEHLSDEEARAN